MTKESDIFQFETLYYAKNAHSNWIFKFLYTGLSWDEVLENENVSGRSALQVPPYAKKYLSTTDKTYNPSTGTLTPIEDVYKRQG